MVLPDSQFITARPTNSIQKPIATNSQQIPNVVSILEAKANGM